MGFAIGDTALNVATPIPQIDRKGIVMDVDYIRTLIEEYDIEKILLGYPLNMDGTKSKMVQETESFFNLLKSKINVEIDFIDERLSSFEAEEMIKSIQADYKKRKNIVDSISALVILRDYMERK